MTAAFGKMGGLCGTYAFLPIVNNLGKKYTFLGERHLCLAALAGIFTLPSLKEEELIVRELTNDAPKSSHIAIRCDAVGGCLGFLGVALTQFFLVNKLGHDFSEEDEDFDRYLDAKGYTGPRGTQGEGSVPTSA